MNKNVRRRTEHKVFDSRLGLRLLVRKIGKPLVLYTSVLWA